MMLKKFKMSLLRTEILKATCLLLGALTLSYLYPPYYFYVSGTDASVFTGISYQIRFGHESSKMFLPPGTDMSKARLLDETFTDIRGDSLPKERMIGIMTPYIVINKNREIEFSHFRLYPWILGAARFLPNWFDFAEYLNYLLLFVGIYFLYLILRNITKDDLASLLAAFSMYFVPTLMAISREPLSELLAFALNMILIYSALTKRVVIAGVVVSLLAWTRGGYILIAIVYLLWIGWDRIRYPKAAVFVAASLWLLHYYLYSYVFNYVHPDAYMPYLLSIGLFSPLLVLFGLALGKLHQTFEPFFKKAMNMSLAMAPVLIILMLGGLYYYDLVKVKSGLTRYSTFTLLWKSSGILLPLGALFLLLNTKSILRYVSLLALILFIPHLFVLYDMGASPVYTVYWTRRFVASIYPLLCLGIAYFLVTVRSFCGSQKAAVSGVICISLLFYLGMYSFHQDTFQGTRPYVLNRGEIEKFDRSATMLPPDSIVVLSSENFSIKGSLPLRTRHGLWSFNVWNQSKLNEALEALPKDFPLLIEKELAPLLDKSKFIPLPQPEVFKIYVGESFEKGENRTIELLRVDKRLFLLEYS